MLKFISADCGAGKTHSLLNQIKRTNDNYILVQGTLQLVHQSTKELGSLVKVITSETTDNVEREFSTFLMNPSHRVLLLTDKAFMRISDMSLLKNWKIYLDDVVNFHNYVSINTEKKFEVEKQLFCNFEKLSYDYLTAKAVTDFDDDLVQSMSERFLGLKDYDHFVMNKSFFDKVGKLGNADVYGNENNQLTILSWIDIAKYSNLDITFMANKFEESLIYLSKPSLFKKTTVEGLRERKVVILPT